MKDRFTIKLVFLACYAVLGALTAVALWIKPTVQSDELVWATDPNPARTEQMDIFRDEYPEYDIMIDPNAGGKQQTITQSLAGVGPDFFDSFPLDIPDFVDAGIAMDLTPIIEMGRHPSPSPEAFRDQPYCQFLLHRYEKALTALTKLDSFSPPSLANNPYYSLLRRRELTAWREAHPGSDPDDAFVAGVQRRAAARAAAVARASQAERKAEAERVAVLHAVDAGKALDPDLLWPVGRLDTTADGHSYAYPCNVWWSLLAYHRDLFDKAGVPYPKPNWTWDDFVEVARKLTIRDPKTGRAEQFGLLGIDGVEIAFNFGADFFNETGTRCVFYRPESVEAIQFSIDLREKYHVSPTASEIANMAAQGGWGAGDINLFGAKKGAMMRFGRYGLITWRLINEQAIKNGDPPPLRVAFIPQPVKKRQYLYGGARVCVINAHSPRRYEAVDFFAYLAGPRYGRQINWSADCLPGPRKWTQTRSQLSNPRYPDEHESDTYWRDTAADIHPFMRSRFLPSATLYQCLYYHLERIGARLCTTDDGLRALQSDINQAIEKHVREHPYLQNAYAAALRQQAEIDRGKTAGSGAGILPANSGIAGWKPAPHKASSLHCSCRSQ